MYHSFLIHSSAALCLFKVQLVFGLRLNNLEGTQPRPSKENQIKDLLTILVQFSSVQSLSRVQLFATPWIAGRQASLSITNSQVHPNSCASSRWCHPTISSSVIPISCCLQSLPASVSFPMINSSHEVAKVLEFQLWHQSFQWTPRTGLL